MITGKDVFISKNAEILRPELCTIGDHVAIDSGFYCTTKLTIGSWVHISSHVSVIGGKEGSLTLCNFSSISAGAQMICGSDSFLGDGIVGPFIPDEYADTKIVKPIVLKRFSAICTGCIVFPGVTIAEGSVLGAASVLKESTEPWTIYVGNPARPVKLRKSENMIRYAKELGYEDELS
jgi:acetyltransferase-like isoleucine patch superfamily enzyme